MNDKVITQPDLGFGSENVKDASGQRKASYRHLFQVLPVELQDTAFLDRIHAYLPGWEMPEIRPENYATGYGLLTDNIGRDLRGMTPS